MSGSHFRTPASLLAATSLVVVVLMTTGCGSGLPATTPVRGTVTYMGEPVEGATVNFGRGSWSVAEGELAIGTTDAGGHFELVSYFGPQASSPGVVPGQYVVTISKPKLPQGITEAKYQSLKAAADEYNSKNLPAPPGFELPVMVEQFPSYANARVSDLKATVTEGADNQPVFELK